jgi:HEAT repeat protein
LESELNILKKKIKHDDWETCRSAVERLAEIDSEEATSILLDMLRSDEAQVRNLTAVAMQDTRDQKYFAPLLRRINELGTKGQIGTLVYALENLDCSRNLYDIANLNLNAGTNVEVKHSTTAILNKQSFRLTRKEFEEVRNLLDKFDFTMDGFDVKYEIVC